MEWYASGYDCLRSACSTKDVNIRKTFIILTELVSMVDRVRFNRALIRIERVAGWLLFFLIILFVVTGYSITGKYGAGRLIGAKLSLAVHQQICYVLIPLFLIHSLINIRFALIRWGVLKHGSEKKKKR